jgi:hypothetical protein
MLFFQISYNMTKPIGEMGQRNWMGQKNLDNIVPDNYTRENNWNQNRAAMREGSFTGIGTGMYTTGITLQDYATMESMGAITDRTSEQIGPADQAIVKGRRVFLEAVRAHMAGQPALGVDQDLSGVGREGGAEYIDAA